MDREVGQKKETEAGGGGDLDTLEVLKTLTVTDRGFSCRHQVPWELNWPPQISRTKEGDWSRRRRIGIPKDEN